MRHQRILLSALVLLLILALTAGPAGAATSSGSLQFTNNQLADSGGASEPAIAITNGGFMAMTGLNWINGGTDLWTGPYGSVPSNALTIDNGIGQPGRTVFGGGDADVDLNSATGTLHASTLVFIANPKLNSFQLGVSAIACPNVVPAGVNLATCKRQIIDLGGADRQWITSDGNHVYISYHDSVNASLIRVQRSDDDGYTWAKVGDPIVGQDGATANSTFNNIQGPIVADPSTHSVYDVYAAGETGFLKGRTFTPNHIYVSRSTDGGKTWTANLVFTAPAGTSLAHIFPALAVDPTNGRVYAAWSDQNTQLWFSASSDHGSTWTPAVKVNATPANTAVFPWLAAYGGVVDLVYYGTPASGTNDPAAVWNVYLAQTLDNGASFAQNLVSNKPNHVGVICTGGAGCPNQLVTRTLLDLFEVVINPANGKTAIVYVDDTEATFSLNGTTYPLPEVWLAQQK